MNLRDFWRAQIGRREAVTMGVTALAPFAFHLGNPAGHQAPTINPNGGPDPYPIPWLDKNGSHNQPAGANLEPSNIYHFKGRVARCSTFTGMGTDQEGNRVPFGSRTTDYSVMQGNTGPDGRRITVSSPTYDSRCSGDRWFPRISSTIFIRRLRRPDCIGSCRRRSRR
jgi:hypothetical protein